MPKALAHKYRVLLLALRALPRHPRSSLRQRVPSTTGRAPSPVRSVWTDGACPSLAGLRPCCMSLCSRQANVCFLSPGTSARHFMHLDSLSRTVAHLHPLERKPPTLAPTLSGTMPGRTNILLSQINIPPPLIQILSSLFSLSYYASPPACLAR